MTQDAQLKRHTLITITMASFLTPFMGSAVNLAIPAIGEQFNASAMHLSWVVTSYILASAAFLVPFGRLADIVGRKKVFIAGNISFFLFSLLCGLATSVEMLIAFRALQGIGSALIFGTAMAILTSVFPPQERGKILGINVATVYTGLSLGPVLGGSLNHNLGWQSIFYFCAIIGLAVIIMSLTRLKGEWAGARGERYDLTGAVLYSFGLVLFMYGISSIGTSAWSGYILTAGLVILAVFIRHELKTELPVLNLKLFSKNVTFAFSNLAALINYSATFAVGFLVSLYLQVVLGYNSQQAGFILLSQPVLMAVLSPFAGKLSDRVQPRLVASWGMALCTTGLFIFVFLTRQTPIWLVLANLALLGVGFALFSSPNSNAVMGSVEKKFYGIASSTLGTMRLTGQAISMAMATLIITMFVGNVELQQADVNQLTKSIKIAFTVFAVTCLAGIFASLARGNMHTENRPVHKPGN
ncbi:MFS transporter [Desulfallas thermosapovorans]|uniref:EmrB/QacA subfamily drug resistance transporter n=1 Tax=Desulfallas thermosapovorans DSM 6562 TaxID=1121431 RepID=A0A5S4ZMU4_9FIRM|nr:MFS transporter [Desulfallas thermosapovorans]TYO92729.1 EmrB/QacA subfamily drug resistance transporter [Desulfallas thermosapovorans DSM 6562]